MIKGYKTITMESFLKNIFPHMGSIPDVLLRDFNDAVDKDRDYIVIFHDYEVKIPLAEVKAHLEKVGGKTEGGVAADPIDAFFPASDVKQPETPAEVEARAIAAKHPKTAPPMPAFKPGKKAPSAPEGFTEDGE
jgi:hypothetical protein